MRPSLSVERAGAAVLPVCHPCPAGTLHIQPPPPLLNRGEMRGLLWRPCPTVLLVERLS
jgi:hypothetical protein